MEYVLYAILGALIGVLLLILIMGSNKIKFNPTTPSEPSETKKKISDRYDEMLEEFKIK
jgi:hypothetical protein|tara:strand:- start:4488 stop:4664 length:177 start_codon:yes stop_codon:yes gene_type:complete